MAAKKKSAKKEVAPKTKRPPKQVFITYDSQTGSPLDARKTRKEALDCKVTDELIAGPYVLVERVRNK